MITLDDIDSRIGHALATGALAPIDTIETAVEEAGVRFVVRRVSSLARKAAAAWEPQRSPGRNPLLPPEADLTVGEVGPAHVAVLNKFPVIDRHLLIVTREFVPQDALLDADDFAALASVMRAFPSLGFYNGGQAGGASQPHKHLQVVPLPLRPGDESVPIAPWVEAARFADGFGMIGAFDLAHALVRLDPEMVEVFDAAARLEAAYRALLRRVGIAGVRGPEGELQSAPYNLLVAREWMLVVRRTREHADGISVNALGYAGSLFVRDEAQLALIVTRGPLAVLRAVAAPLDASTRSGRA